MVRISGFLIIKNKDKNLSTVGVYRGEVEVKTRGSDKSVMITPNGDKPGVVVVTQKLSVLKLILGGVVLVVVIGGIVLLLKRRGSKIFRTKRKK